MRVVLSKLLYISKVDTDNTEAHCSFTQQPNEKHLDKDEQLLCEGFLNRKECLDALKNMNSFKSPGTDGLPCEFCKVFVKFTEILINYLNYFNL